MRLSELEEKEVVNIKTCKKLGYINDLELDMCNGCIKSVIVPCRRFCLPNLLGEKKEYVIPFCQLKQIGPDIILVEMSD
ncbi:MAG: YlmC/YmxH family sporulation protein [Lachnospiraceae bacterium]